MARLRFVPSIRVLSLPLQGRSRDNSHLAPDSGKAAEKFEFKCKSLQLYGFAIERYLFIPLIINRFACVARLAFRLPPPSPNRRRLFATSYAVWGGK